MKQVFIALLLLICSQSIFAERYVQPTFYAGQKEILDQGGSIILSNKENSVLMYQTCGTIKYRRGNFMLAIFNETDEPVNFHFHDLKVTDQWGRPVRVVPKRELIKDKKRKRDGELFFLGIESVQDAVDSKKAGVVRRASHTQYREKERFRSRGTNGWVDETFDRNGASRTHETLYSEALRRQELREARRDKAIRSHEVETEYRRWKEGLTNFYFDSTTLFPGERYQANFQIEIPSRVEKDLQYLIFTFNVGGEEHAFSYFCGIEKKKWYRFGF